jgi:RNA recognition motif-containing protein
MGKLYVGNIPWTTTEEQLKNLFSKFGTVGAVRIVSDKDTGRPKGFAFVEVQDSDKAIAELNNTDFNGRPLRVNAARERESYSPRPPQNKY